MKKCHVVMAAVAAALLSFAPAGAADLSEVGRAKAQEVGGAVVTIKIVATMKISYGGREMDPQEARSESRGTMLDDTGLTVVSLSEVDPAAMYRKMSGDKDEDTRFETNLKDMKIVLADNTEIPATVVLRDNDLDIAVVRPIEKQKTKLPFVNMKEGADAKLLDRVFALGRMGKIGGRTTTLMSGEIQAVISKPRKFYISGGDMNSSGTGVPVFTADGKVVGMNLIHAQEASADRDSSGSGSDAMPVIVPAADIWEIASQAPEKAPDTKAASDEKPAAKSDAKDEKAAEKKSDEK